MTYDQLEVLEKVVEMGSFKAAARALHRTQPTLSVSIKKLEAEFGFQIFSRDEYRPKLTSEGELFYKWARECLSSYRRLGVIGHELGVQKVEPKLVLAIDPLASFKALEVIFKQCLGEMNATEVTLQTEILCAGVELLRSGTVDFAIATKEADADDIESLPIERIDMVPVAAKSVIGSTKKMSRAWLSEHTQIIVTSARGDVPASGLSVGVLQGGRQCFVTDHEMKRRLIVAGFGWGRLSREEIRRELAAKSLYEISCEAAPSFSLDLFLMRSRGKPMGPIARKMWSAMSASAPKPNR